MDADYLQSTLGDLLSEGLAHTVLQNPADKVEFLARWIQKTVAARRAAAGVQKEAEEKRALDLEVEAVELQAAEAEAAAESSAEQSAVEREKQFTALIDNAASRAELLPQFLTFLRDLTQASSAYFGIVERHPDAEGAEQSSLKYLAATPESEWMLEQRLDANKGKTTFELFAPEDEEEQQEEDENGNPIPRPAKPLKSVFVPNVLLGPKSANLHFFKRPQLGSYVGVRVSFPACVSDEVLDESVEREEEIAGLKAEADEARRQAEREAREEAAREAGIELEEEEEDDEDEDDEDDESDDDGRSARSGRSSRRSRRGADHSASDDGAPDESEEDREARLKAEDEAKQLEEEEFMLTQLQSRQPINYALCLDTLGQNRRFTEEQLETIQRAAAALQAKLQSLDRGLFSEQRRLRQSMLEFNREVLEDGEGALRSEEEKAEEMERISEELEAAGKPMTEEDVHYRYRTELILAQLKPQLAEWGQMECMRGPLAVLQAVLFLLGYPKSAVVDAAGVPDWQRMRVLLSGDDESFFGKLRDYDPRATSHDSLRKTNPELLYTESVEVSKLVEPIDEEDVRAKNYALFELLQWAKEVIAVKRRAKGEREREARRARAAAAAAEEAARLAEERAAEEAERAANGEEEGDEDGEDEEEDDEDE